MRKSEIVGRCFRAPIECWSREHRCFVSRREQILLLANRVLGSSKAAERWLIDPALGLGHRVPCGLLLTGSGYTEIAELLSRIEYGVYT